MRFLNMDLDIPASGGKVAFAPAFKLTSLMRPIAEIPAHHPSVHRAWPVQFLRSLRKISSSKDAFAKAADVFLSRFIRYSASRTVLDRLHDELQGISPHRRERSHLDIGRPDLWLVVPFHPATARAIKRAVEASNIEPHRSTLYAMSFNRPAPMIRCAWQNALPKLSNII